MNTKQHQRCVLLITVLISLFFAPVNVLPSSDIEEFKNTEEQEHIQSEKYALLFGGGFNNKNNLESFYANIEYVYDALRQLRYKNGGKRKILKPYSLEVKHSKGLLLTVKQPGRDYSRSWIILQQ